jgi:hypothetical protein
MAVSDSVRWKQKGIEQRVNRRCSFALMLMRVRLQEVRSGRGPGDPPPRLGAGIRALSHILTISPIEGLTLH